MLVNVNIWKMSFEILLLEPSNMKLNTVTFLILPVKYECKCEAMNTNNGCIYTHSCFSTLSPVLIMSKEKLIKHLS